MENLIILAVVGVILGLAAGYLYKAKKRGVKCVGCPDARSCSSNGGCSDCAGCNGCGGNSQTK